MKKHDWPSAFGPTPDIFRALVLQSCQEEETKMIKKRFSPALVAALLILLFAVTAFALANRAGLMDFLGTEERKEHKAFQVSLEHDAGEGATLMQQTVGDLVVTVTEARGDGKMYFTVTTIALREGAKGRVMGFNALWDVFDRLREEGVEPAPVEEDTTYVWASIASGDISDCIENEDGSLSFFSDAKVFTLEDTADMEAILEQYTIPAGEAPRTGRPVTIDHIPFTMPTYRALETRKMAAPQAVEGTGVTMEQLYMKRTEHTTHVSFYFSYEGGEPVGYLPLSYFGTPGVELLLRDENGGAIALGETMQGGDPWKGGARFRLDYELSLEKLPNQVIVEVFDAVNRRALGQATITLESGKLDERAMTAYAERPFPAQAEDYLGIAEEGVITLVKTDNPEGADVRTDPNDPASYVGKVQSGVMVTRVGILGDWTEVYIANRYDPFGYVETKYLTDMNADQVEQTLRIYEVMPVSGDLAPLRRAAGDEAVIDGKLDKGEKVRVILIRDEWALVESAPGEPRAAYGYAPLDALK